MSFNGPLLLSQLIPAPPHAIPCHCILLQMHIRTKQITKHLQPDMFIHQLTTSPGVLHPLSAASGAQARGVSPLRPPPPPRT